jgi:uracil-DNA glycosylase
MPASPTAEGRAAALEQVQRAARVCRDCPLGEIGTQTVFGLGPATAGQPAPLG